MFYTKNKRARKHFIGRRLPKGSNGVNIYYSTPLSRREKKQSILTIIDKKNNVRIDIGGREIYQLKRMLKLGDQLMNMYDLR